MNKMYGAALALIFLGCIGAFNFAMGYTTLKKRGSRRWVSYFRMSLGVLLILSSLGIYLFLHFQGSV